MRQKQSGFSPLGSDIVDSAEFDGASSEAQMLCTRQKNLSVYLRHILTHT